MDTYGSFLNDKFGKKGESPQPSLSSIYFNKPPFKYGKREDGTDKGMGFFGELKRPDGNVSTELSIGVELGGKETQIPLLVPTLSDDEIKSLLNGGKPTKEIVDKAAQYAIMRMKQGKKPFAQEGEQRNPNYKESQ